MSASPDSPPPRDPAPEPGAARSPRLSLVVPVFDEEPNLRPLYEEIRAALDAPGVDLDWELILVDDRSSDGSWRVMRELRSRDGRVRLVRLRHRSGQTAAMAAGFDHARGEIVVTLDGDLQNDPADVPALVRRLEEGFDVVAGWRRRRHDGFWLRRLPSIVANRLISRVTGVRIHDTGCTLKAFRRQVVEGLAIYGEQHRFLPAIASRSGARVSEMVVNHRPRRSGKSKYGLGRATRVLLDLLTVKMIASFSGRPLTYFVLLALPFLLAALAALGLEAFTPAEGRGAAHGPLATFLVLFCAWVYFLLLGFLAELAVRVGGLHREPARRRVMQVTPDG